MHKQDYHSAKKTCIRRQLANAKGGVLIGAVVAMVIMGALGAGMVSLLGSSSLHEVRANYGERAYFLAESGFRYAVSSYIFGGKAGIEALDGKDDFIPGVHLDVNVETYTAGDGVFAEDFTVKGGWVEVESDGTPKFIVDGEELGNGGNLRVALGGDLPLPKYRGLIKIGGQEARYQRITGPHADGFYRLRDIAFPNSDDKLTFDQINDTAGELVFPVEIADITSKGTYPTSGLASLLSVSRSINYYWPLSGVFSGDPDNPPPVDFFNLPDLKIPSSLSSDDRFNVTPGDFQQEARVEKKVDGEQGVRVKLQNTDRVFVNINWWNFDNFDINSAYLFQNKTLTYDLQIKMKWGDKNNFNYYLTGVSARVSSNNMRQDPFYGMSLFYIKEKQDNPAAWVSPALQALDEQTPYLIFWKISDNGENIGELNTVELSLDVDWVTVVFRIEETGSGTNKVNKVMAIIYDESENPRGTLNWPPQYAEAGATELYRRKGWDSPVLEATYTHNQQEDLSTGVMETIPITRPEIGFHGFSDFGAQNELMFDDFAARVAGAVGDGGTPYVPPIQE